MVKMCIFDVDGTLYDTTHHRILDSTIHTIKKLKENGIKVVIATGRCHYGLGKALNDLQMDYVIAVNGGVIVNKQQEVLVRHDFGLEDVNKINEFALKTHAGLCWKFIDHMYIYQFPEKIDWYEGQINSDIGSEPFIDCFTKDHHLLDMPQSASVNADPIEVEKEFNHHESIQFISCGGDGYDVVLKGMNKGKGIAELMKITGFKRDEIMVFGDNYNDLEMFEMADYRIAMDNAINEIKEMATYVTSDCSNDGIYEACLHYKLI